MHTSHKQVKQKNVIVHFVVSAKHCSIVKHMQVGADDDGYAVRLKMKHFLGYLQDPTHMQDDSPMYIFDGTFGDRDGSKALLGDYSVPEWFSEDLMQLAGDRRRPPHRYSNLLHHVVPRTPL